MTHRILVVEDDPGVRELVAKLLGPEYEVRTAADGLAAIQEIEQGFRPHLIIADIMMPRLDGLAMTKALQERPYAAEIPVIFLTAKTATRDIVAGINARARHYVTKPFKIADLLQKVHRVLPRRVKETCKTDVGASATKFRVLVVEDDIDIQRLVATVLARDFEVKVAADGLAAIDEIEKGFGPDLIVADIMMPRLDGLGMAKALKAHQNTAAIPVMFLTAKTAPRDVVEGINLGARYYVTKPFKMDDLVRKVHRVLTPREK